MERTRLQNPQTEDAETHQEDWSRRIHGSGNSRTGDYLANICREITHKYNVDGIHLDYIRYPETWNIKVSREQGRRYITNIVRKIHDAVKAENLG